MLFKLLYCIYAYYISKSKNSLEYLAGKSILGKSFRIDDSVKNSFVQFNREFIKLFFYVLLNNNKQTSSKNDTSECVIFDSNNSSFELRKSYIKSFAKIEVNNFIAREDLGSKINSPKLGTLFSLVILYMALIPVAILSNKRKAIVIIFRDYIEMNALSICLKNWKIRRLYHFNIYEKESNFLSFYLENSLGIKTTKCPSEVPLGFWNKIIICDELIICNAYQLDEIEFFSSTIRVNTFQKWGPENAHKVAPQYKSRDIAFRSNNKLGYISTGAWVREKEGHVDQGFQMARNEQMMLQFFNKFLKGKDLKLIIMLHPREKSKKYMTESTAMYANILNDIPYEFAPIDVPSNQLFDQVDLVVSFYSSLLFERLYFGFKTIFYTLFSDNFPLEKSSIRSICAFREDELEKLIIKSIQLSDKDFFRTMNLENYPYLRD